MKNVLFFTGIVIVLVLPSCTDSLVDNSDQLSPRSCTLSSFLSALTDSATAEVGTTIYIGLIEKTGASSAVYYSPDDVVNNMATVRNIVEATGFEGYFVADIYRYGWFDEDDFEGLVGIYDHGGGPVDLCERDDLGANIIEDDLAGFLYENLGIIEDDIAGV